MPLLDCSLFLRVVLVELIFTSVYRFDLWCVHISNGKSNKICCFYLLELKKNVCEVKENKYIYDTKIWNNTKYEFKQNKISESKIKKQKLKYKNMKSGNQKIEIWNFGFQQLHKMNIHESCPL